LPFYTIYGCIFNKIHETTIRLYAEEISDPENRKLYEQEITQMEQERGMDVQFIHPKPGHVLKTSVDGDMKAFINICQNDKIGKPVSKREVLYHLWLYLQQDS
jgi:hypothetical protein